MILEPVFLAVSATRWDGGRLWEIALAPRVGPATVWYIRSEFLDLGSADPDCLSTTGFQRRHPQPRPGVPVDSTLVGVAGDVRVSDPDTVAWEVYEATRGRQIVGMTAVTDVPQLDLLLRRHKLCPSWYRQFIDLGVLASGFLRRRDPGVTVSTLIDRLARTGLDVGEPIIGTETPVRQVEACRRIFEALTTGERGPTIDTAPASVVDSHCA